MLSVRPEPFRSRIVLGGSIGGIIANHEPAITSSMRGTFAYWITTGSSISPFPSNKPGVMLRQIPTGDRACDVAFGDEGGVYVRNIHNLNEIGNWQRIDNFGCNTLSDLASALGAGKGGILGGNFNFNTLSDGITSYTTLEGTSNAPVTAAANNWGIVITWRNEGAFALQICWNQSAYPGFYIRFGDSSAASINWLAWKKFSFVS